jgi:hypothetical protein
MSDSTNVERPQEISVPVWWNRGNGHLLRRSCLPEDHPESTYNYIKNVLKLKPEDYGYFLNQAEYNELKDKPRHELIDEIISLRKEVHAYMKAGF